MKELKVTGLAQESDFEKEGEIEYLLVFNKGELRIPISQEAAQEVIRAMYSNGTSPKVEVKYEAAEEQQEQETQEPEDEPFVLPDEEQGQASGELLDEDGVGQV